MNEPGPKPSRTWFIVIVSLALVWILYLTFFGPKPGHEGALPAPALKSPFPAVAADPRWVVRDLDDAPVPFTNYQGRVVFLNLWATWCPPCVAELPAIANLASNPRLKEVAFLCVSSDESAEVVRSFLKGKDWPMTFLRATDLPASFATDAIPATFVVAPDGRIVVSEVGSAQWDDPSVVDYLESLVKATKKDKDEPVESPAATGEAKP